MQCFAMLRLRARVSAVTRARARIQTHTNKQRSSNSNITYTCTYLSNLYNFWPKNIYIYKNEPHRGVCGVSPKHYTQEPTKDMFSMWLLNGHVPRATVAATAAWCICVALERKVHRNEWMRMHGWHLCDDAPNARVGRRRRRCAVLLSLC